MPNILTSVFGSRNERVLKQLSKIVVRINALEPEIQGLSDDALRALYRAATALVYPANEDFGIAMAEAQACGTPVVALAEGGALDIVVDGRTGVLIDKAEISILRRAVAQLPKFDSLAIRLNAERFSRERFRARMRNIVLESLSRENGTARIGT